MNDKAPFTLADVANKLCALDLSDTRRRDLALVDHLCSGAPASQSVGTARRHRAAARAAGSDPSGPGGDEPQAAGEHQVRPRGGPARVVARRSGAGPQNSAQPRVGANHQRARAHVAAPHPGSPRRFLFDDRRRAQPESPTTRWRGSEVPLSTALSPRRRTRR